MTAEIPPGVAVETIYIVEATYAPDASERRRPIRVEHLDRVMEMRRAGILLEAGGYADFSSALLLFRTSSAEEALRICREDIYTLRGMDRAARPSVDPGRVGVGAARYGQLSV
jgi:uncharacterized protein YciI